MLLRVALLQLESLVFQVKVGVALLKLKSLVFQIKIEVVLFELESMRLIYTPLTLSLTINSSLIIFSNFSFLEFSVILLSLWWIPLSCKFFASYPLTDSLGDEVNFYPL